MVKETLLTVGPDDVKKRGFECVKCKATMMFDVDGQFHLPDSCPTCLTPWHRDEEVAKCVDLFELIRSIRRSGESPVQMTMVFNGEDA